MVAIILEASEATKQKALNAGFTEATVLLRFEAGLSTEENKRKIEREVRKMRPYHFLVSDTYGMVID